jgi:hypothetical protein
MTFEERLRARRAQIRAQLEGVDVTLLPYYGSARDRIIRPDRALILRSYFIERWLPRLSGDEVKVLLVLRNLARTYGVEAESPVVEVTVKHLVELTGISRGTLNRILAAPHLRESPLGRFVQKEAQRVPGIIGTIQGPNIYHVRMDDPIAPEDEPALREALADLEMERRYSALLAEEGDTGVAPPSCDRVPTKWVMGAMPGWQSGHLRSAQAAPHSEPRAESHPGQQPASQPEKQPEASPEPPPVSRSAAQVIPLRRRVSVPKPVSQETTPPAIPTGLNERQINAGQHMLNNVPNVAEPASAGPTEPLPRDLRQAQRDLHARRLARSFNDTQSMGWYRRVVQRFMDANHEDLLHAAAHDVLELPAERVKTTRARVFTDRVKRLAREYGIDLGLDEPNPA